MSYCFSLAIRLVKRSIVAVLARSRWWSVSSNFVFLLFRKELYLLAFRQIDRTVNVKEMFLLYCDCAVRGWERRGRVEREPKIGEISYCSILFDDDLYVLQISNARKRNGRLNRHKFWSPLGQIRRNQSSSADDGNFLTLIVCLFWIIPYTSSRSSLVLSN